MTEMFTPEGQTPEATPNEGQTPENGETATETVSEYETRLRAENAKRRKLNEALTAKLQTYEAERQAAADAELSQVELLQKKSDELANQLAAAKSLAETQEKKVKLITMAAKAGLPPGASDMLDVNAFDLSNEEATIEALSLLKPQHVPNGGGPSNPPKQEKPGDASPADWYAQRMGNNPSIFGG